RHAVESSQPEVGGLDERVQFAPHVFPSFLFLFHQFHLGTRLLLDTHVLFYNGGERLGEVAFREHGGLVLLLGGGDGTVAEFRLTSEKQRIAAAQVVVEKVQRLIGGDAG